MTSAGTRHRCGEANNAPPGIRIYRPGSARARRQIEPVVRLLANPAAGLTIWLWRLLYADLSSIIVDNALAVGKLFTLKTRAKTVAL